MIRILFTFFILWPLLEIILFIQVGKWIGTGWTVAFILFTVFWGLNVIRRQQKGVFQRTLKCVQERHMPAFEFFEGVCLILAGVMLMVPGFLTDIIGFFLLIEPVRAILWRRVLARTASLRTESPTTSEGMIHVKGVDKAIKKDKP